MIKKGVTFFGIQPEMVFAHFFIKEVFDRHGIECIPTSVTGKKHGTRSLHPIGYAEDLRTKHIKGDDRAETLKNLLSDLKKEVPQCDFILEHVGMIQEHIHAEYDDKDDVVFQAKKRAYRISGTFDRR